MTALQRGRHRHPTPTSHRASDHPSQVWPLVTATQPLRAQVHGRHVAAFATPAERTYRALQALVPQQRQGEPQ